MCVCVCVTGKDKRREGHKKSKAHTFGLPTCSIPYNNVGSIATPKHMYALTCAKPIRSECILIPNMSLLPDASSSLEHALLSSLRSGLTNFGDAQNDHIEVLTHPLKRQKVCHQDKFGIATREPVIISGGLLTTQVPDLMYGNLACYLFPLKAFQSSIQFPFPYSIILLVHFYPNNERDETSCESSTVQVNKRLIAYMSCAKVLATRIRNGTK